MGNITLCRNYSQNVTIVNNNFIDDYMCEANDAQIKIYLYLLRCINSGNEVVLDDISDRFNYTERDVIKALKYWNKKKLLSLSFNSCGNLTCIQLMDTPSENADKEVKRWDFSEIKDEEDDMSGNETGNKAVSILSDKFAEDDHLKIKDRLDSGGNIQLVDFTGRTEYSEDEIAGFKNDPGISQLLFVAEAYLGKTLRPDEITSILFMYDSYGFKPDLIEYLIEYCANNKKKNIKYIESVAKNWAQTGISTVEEAKRRTGNAPKEVYEVFRAFGIRGRDPIEPEISYVYKWTNIFGFGIDIICEACTRTVMSIHSASFEYADTILSNWNNAGVRVFEDIKTADAKHADKSIKRPSGTSKKSKEKAVQGIKGGFNDFSQRKYNYKELEEDALRNQG
ncbi:MAG: DnaD domain protein [Lachnospiraceae bacterium]|nr:DnaD domain protein [Lachnospiraceae bacterium]